MAGESDCVGIPATPHGTPTRSPTGEGGSSEAEDDVATGVARSPAVGYFSPAARAGRGAVRAGG